MASKTVPVDDPVDELALADVLETVVKMALAPVVARLRALEATTSDVPVLRERVAALAAVAPVPGPPGPPGADGLGFDDYTVDYDGARSMTHKWARGEKREERVVVLPIPLYQGVYVAGRVYNNGDEVTSDGSIFHCNADDTTTRPGDGSRGWTLKLKRGRDYGLKR